MMKSEVGGAQIIKDFQVLRAIESNESYVK